MKMSQRIHVSFEKHPELLEKIKRIAEKECTTPPAIIRKAVKELN